VRPAAQNASGKHMKSQSRKLFLPELVAVVPLQGRDETIFGSSFPLGLMLLIAVDNFGGGGGGGGGGALVLFLHSHRLLLAPD